MKNEFALPGAFKIAASVFLLTLGLSFSSKTMGQFTSTWALTADQTVATSGAAAANVTASSQAMSGTLFIPVANSYVGTTSGTAGDGQRCSPKQNDGNDGGWLIDGSAVEGRYMEFAISPNAGFDMNINTISFYIGNRSSSNLRGSAYYYVGASNAGFTIATGTALGVGLRAASSSNQYNAQYVYGSLNIPVTSGNKIFVRIYPYNTASLTTGKYFCTKQVAISGTTTTPNFTNITFTNPVTCNTSQTTISWTGPAGFNPATQTILAFLKPTSAINVGAPPYDILANYTGNTAFGAGTNYAGDVSGTARCIYKGTGTNAAGDHSGLLITGLAANTTYHLLIFYVTNATNVYSAGAVGNGTTLKASAAPTALGAMSRTLQTTSSLPLTWTTVVGTLDGYQLQASNVATPASPANGTDLGIQTDLTAGTGTAKVIPAAAGYNSFTNLSAGTMYYFRNNTYVSSGACISYNLTNRLINAATLPNPVTNPSFAINSGTGTGTITWTTASGYNAATNTTLVFIKAGAPVNTSTLSSNPAQNPAGYAANPGLGLGTAYTFDAAASCIYNLDGTSCTVTGLSAGVTYHILILTSVNASNTNVGGAIPGIQTGVTYSTSAYATTSAIGGNTYTWNAGNTAGDWTIAANWTPVRTTPVATDQLIFNTGEVIAPINFTSQTIAGLTITANTSVNIAGASQTLTITNNNGLLNTDLVINTGSTLSLSGIMSIVLSASTLADVSGRFNVNTGCTFNNSAAGAVTTVSGTLRNGGTFTWAVPNNVITSTGTYDHAINGGTIPTATWASGSTCLVSGITSVQTLMGHRQSFSKFVWDCAGQTNYFILGSATSGAGTLPPIFEALDSFIVRRTNGQILQLTSSGGQRDITCGNFIQYGGIVAVTYNTNDAGGQRSLSVNNSFYVSDSLSNARFQIVNNTVDNTNGRLYVGGSVVMRVVNGGTVTLEKTPSASTAELWFTGTNNQFAKFSTITDSVDFVTAQSISGFNVTLGSNAKIRQLKLTQGTFNIASNTLTIARNVSYPSPGTGLIGGSSTSNLTLTQSAGNAGTLNFAAGSRLLKDFTQTAGNSVSLGTELSITAGATPGRDSLGAGATLTTNDNLILRSDANGTARMAQLPATATIVGKVTVERYLPMDLTAAARRWRLLTAPFKTTNSPTINAAWQEGVSTSNRLAPVDPKPGYGTQITKSQTWAADGYDQGSTNNPSIFYYSNGSNSWLAPANTNAVKITDNSGCYMLFARGDRSIVVSTTSVAAAPTTLDPKGELNIGNVTLSQVSSGYQTVGNPYASQIKLDNIDFNGTLGKSSTIYLWDPKQVGSTFNVGKFITCSGDGAPTPGYTYTGNASAYGSMPGVIESSGAFMVQGTGGNIVFHETDKTMTSSTIGIASRPIRPFTTPGSFGIIKKLYADLLVTKDGQAGIADGVAVTFNRNYSNSIDRMDAPKLSSFSTKEDLGIRRDGQLLSIERRTGLSENDTVFLNISKLAGTNYQFGFRPVDFDNSFTAYLEDKFLHTAAEISLANNSAMAFSITTAPESYASDRFRITFKRNPAFVKPPATAAVSVYPNPVTDGKINLQMEEMPDGIYGIKLINNLGQVVCNSKITHRKESEAHIIDVTHTVSKGIYHLEIISASKVITTVNVSVQ